MGNPLPAAAKEKSKNDAEYTYEAVKFRRCYSHQLVRFSAIDVFHWGDSLPSPQTPTAMYFKDINLGSH